ncbi:MAG: orotidine 5'-phosphate decarboxylase subfamily protein [Chlorobi bacterium OLB4]|jgi:orotidine 5'-phosphate decarboxylase, subfamily 2|nr:MAG: orotidine 5'-phosphate decarboxylase subfamily protein [Chlorobi bacterium OLB4]MBW7855729.1 orotidine-5'-phosphate decarboxylase [Ignavibacteria bacterium]OQY76464.1 MAG: orotidine-5'-phosphate decarboxylase [Ignavibacteriales bacterium UTCHB1]
MSYSDLSKHIIQKKKSHLVVGLDTDISKVPEYFRGFINPVLEFNKNVIDATKDIVAGYKMNSAFYEAAGGTGLNALLQTADYIPDNCLKIVDAKRSDISNSAEQYAKIFFDKMDFDSITINPYMGYDAAAPFLERNSRGIYVLALTSNPSASEFQKLKVGNKYLFELIIDVASKWKKGSVGFVFGANHLKEIKSFSKKYSDIPLLIPGIGFQGNDLNNLLKNLNSENFLINSSRGIIYAPGKKVSNEEFKSIIIKKVISLNNSINKF